MIVVGYSADRYGTAALEHGITEAKRRNTNLLVINATRGDSLADPRFAQSEEVHDVEERLNRCGVEYELAQPVGAEAAEELLKAMEHDDAELLVVDLARQRSPVGKLLLGSVASKCCWNAPSRCSPSNRRNCRCRRVVVLMQMRPPVPSQNRKLYKGVRSQMAKIAVRGTVVELDGDEMTRMVKIVKKEKLILPYLDVIILIITIADGIGTPPTIKLPSTPRTNSKAWCGCQCATITPDEARVAGGELRRVQLPGRITGGFVVHSVISTIR